MLVLDDKGKDEEGLAKDAIEKGALQEEPEPVITLDEYLEFIQDFYEIYWNPFYPGADRHLYVVFQVLQVKEGV